MDGSRSEFAMMQYNVGSTKHKIESPQLPRTAASATRSKCAHIHQQSADSAARGS